MLPCMRARFTREADTSTVDCPECGCDMEEIFEGDPPEEDLGYAGLPPEYLCGSCGMEVAVYWDHYDALNDRYRYEVEITAPGTLGGDRRARKGDTK